MTRWQDINGGSTRTCHVVKGIVPVAETLLALTRWATT